jgi:hypothetical protein
VTTRAAHYAAFVRHATELVERFAVVGTAA